MNNDESHAAWKPDGLRPSLFFIFVILICAASIFGTTSGSFAAVKIPAPSWMEQTAIADKMIINGLPSTVHAFQAERKLAELLEFYRVRWNEGGIGEIGYKEAEVAPWHVISRLEDGRFLLTVQAKEKDALTCEGYLAIADLREVKAGKESGNDIPRPHGSDIVNDLKSSDPGSKSRTVMLVNNSSVAGNSNYYRDYYLGRDWGQVVDQETGDARVLVFGKGSSQVHLVISPAGSKTQVVMNLVDSY